MLHWVLAIGVGDTMCGQRVSGSPASVDDDHRVMGAVVDEDLGQRVIVRLRR